MYALSRIFETDGKLGQGTKQKLNGYLGTSEAKIRSAQLDFL